MFGIRSVRRVISEPRRVAQEDTFAKVSFIALLRASLSSQPPQKSISVTRMGLDSISQMSRGC